MTIVIFKPAIYKIQLPRKRNLWLLAQLIAHRLRVDFTGFIPCGTFSCVSNMFDLRDKVARGTKLRKIFAHMVNYQLRLHPQVTFDQPKA